MSREIEVHAIYVHEGWQWPITVRGHIADDRDVAKALTQVIAWCKQLGLRPAGTPHAEPGPVSPNGLPHIPNCPVHHVPMKPSNFTQSGYVATYYCPKKTGSAYCKHQAHISADGVLDRTS